MRLVLRHRVGAAAIVLVAAGAPRVPAAVAVASDPRVAMAAVQAPSDARRQAFAEWLADLRKEALSKGISEKTVALALTDIETLPVVLERDRTQAERTLPLDEYLKRRLDRRTIRTAREMRRRHAAVLGRVSRHYRVSAGVIVAIWGLESNFGRFAGVRPTISTLATLAYDDRRGAMFRAELFDALRILDRGDIGLDRMKGSWAGAMGQPQFMPSSYLASGQDFDGDGRTDIWQSHADVFASVANYLRQKGWKAGERWGVAVKLSQAASARVESSVPMRTEGCEAVRQMTEPRPWSTWKRLGIALDGHVRTPAPAMPASLVRAGSRSYLVFDNYGALLEYNCAHAYALSVAQLADAIGR